MKKKLMFCFAVLGIGAMLCSCGGHVEPPEFDGTQVEGAWELKNIRYDYEDPEEGAGSFERTYEDKESVWWFHDGAISEWSYWEEDKEWEFIGEMQDRRYKTEGEGADMVLTETIIGMLPGGTPVIRNYRVLCLTKAEMILHNEAEKAIYYFVHDDALLDYLLLPD